MLSFPVFAQTVETPQLGVRNNVDISIDEYPPTGETSTVKNSSTDPKNAAPDGEDWISHWLSAVDKARASQPHYVSPIVTTHVLLVQQFRHDIGWQEGTGPNSGSTTYGLSHGLEIVPTTRLEVGLLPPNYVTHQSNVRDGFGDFSFQVKYRLSSAPEGEGDYFVGLFFDATLPTGSAANGAGHSVLSPTFALAKGFGPWNIQTTIGGSLPASGTNALGRSIVFNTETAYSVKGRIWPMLEQNTTFWSAGTLDGKKQTFITPGLVVGPFPVKERLHFTVGGGYQIAATSFRQYNHRWILSLRFPF